MLRGQLGCFALPMYLEIEMLVKHIKQLMRYRMPLREK